MLATLIHNVTFGDRRACNRYIRHAIDTFGANGIIGAGPKRLQPVVRSGPEAGGRAERSGGAKRRSGAERGHPPEGRGEPRAAAAEDPRK